MCVHLTEPEVPVRFGFCVLRVSVPRECPPVLARYIPLSRVNVLLYVSSGRRRAGGRPDATWLGADAVGGRGMLGLIASAQQAAMSRPGHYTAPGARTHLKNTYLPSWKALFLHETDAAYPMPKAGEVLDLLPALQGIPGAAIKTDPGTTVTEGMGYAMLAAGMQRDV